MKGVVGVDATKNGSMHDLYSQLLVIDQKNLTCSSRAESESGTTAPFLPIVPSRSVTDVGDAPNAYCTCNATYNIDHNRAR